jgi:hypothetical protein
MLQIEQKAGMADCSTMPASIYISPVSSLEDSPAAATSVKASTTEDQDQDYNQDQQCCG